MMENDDKKVGMAGNQAAAGGVADAATRGAAGVKDGMANDRPGMTDTADKDAQVIPGTKSDVASA